jgi:hypothetical protein
MNSSKLKTLVILMLLLVNGSFLGLWLADKYQSGRIEENTEQGLIRVLAQQGIDMDEEAIPEESPRRRFVLTRDTAKERELAERLLGQVAVEEMGGGFYQYVSDKGTARFTGNGRFEIFLKPDSQAERTADALMEELLAKLDITAVTPNGETEHANDPNTAGRICLYDDSRIFNNRLTVTLLSDNTAEIVGTGVIGSVAYLNDAEALSPVTALISLAGEIRENEISCGTLLRVEAGFQMLVTASGTTLEPVWRIETDSGDLYLDCVTGKLVLI